MKKGELFRLNNTDSIYQVAGKWDLCIVLMPVSEKDDQVLVYELDELEALIREGRFRILHKLPIVQGENS
ncbi:MAG: hypothetical protein HGA49_00245 [Eubacteriaceae bacterium]|nr:hypothetical protein [Eubacteriaceae bacterium]